MTGGITGEDVRALTTPHPRYEVQEVAVTARMLIKQRDLRAAYLPTCLFREPDWDMLLDLLASECEDEEVSITALCFASRASTSTAIRMINQLIAKGLVERIRDPNDRRRSFIRLSGATSAVLNQYLQTVRHEGASDEADKPPLRGRPI